MAVQTPLWQSDAARQALLVVQRAQVVAPPQSASLSPPFLTVSLQLAAWQSLGEPEQTRLVQSVGTLQLLPVAQRLQLVAPPQSVSLSPPFFATSLQVGA